MWRDGVLKRLLKTKDERLARKKDFVDQRGLQTPQVNPKRFRRRRNNRRNHPHPPVTSDPPSLAERLLLPPTPSFCSCSQLPGTKSAFLSP